MDSAFPPATPLLDILNRVTRADYTAIPKRLRMALTYLLIGLTFIGILLQRLPGLLHRALKRTVILLRATADILDRLDTWLDDDQPVTPAPEPEPQPVNEPLTAAVSELVDILVPEPEPAPSKTTRRVRTRSSRGFGS